MLKSSTTSRDRPRIRLFFQSKAVLLSLVSLGLGCAIVLVTLPVGEAATEDDPYLKCADVKKSKRRLECYDTVLKALHPAMFKKIEAATKKEQREDFGAPTPAAGSKDSEKLKLLKVVIVDFSRTSHGKWVLTTEGGQIWRQADNQGLSPFAPKRPFNASIKRGALGSYYLVIEGSKRSIRVKRLK